MLECEEQELLIKLAQKDLSAYEIVFNDFYSSLCSYAYSFLNDFNSAEDVVQDIFSYLWSKNQSFSSFLVLKGYLYTSVKNRCLDKLKHQKVKDQYFNSSFLSLHVNEDILEKMLEDELYDKLEQAINQLPLRMREVFELVVEGKTNEEIASEMQLSVDAVKGLRKRGKKMLKLQLTTYFFNMLILLKNKMHIY